ncbi:MAG: DUF1273 family protein [Ruminiclostridium sp.]|nr:DUF1273 family protein [Ruminiclostridium sp.]
MTVSFTGHRNADPAVRTALYNTIKRLAEAGADTFCAGGAAGFDTLAAQEVIRVKSEMPGIKLRLVLPCPPGEQTKKFSREMKEAYVLVLRGADEQECVSPHYTPGCMKARNQRLIDLADICICYYDSENNSASGTGQTVRMAKKKGIQIINLF